MEDDRLIAVLGATGLQGKAVVRQLAAEGWRVRALTRRPQRKKATRLASMGVDVVQADMEDAASLERAFSGVKGSSASKTIATPGTTANCGRRRSSPTWPCASVFLTSCTPELGPGGQTPA